MPSPALLALEAAYGTAHPIAATRLAGCLVTLPGVCDRWEKAVLFAPRLPRSIWGHGEADPLPLRSSPLGFGWTVGERRSVVGVPLMRQDEGWHRLDPLQGRLIPLAR